MIFSSAFFLPPPQFIPSQSRFCLLIAQNEAFEKGDFYPVIDFTRIWQRIFRSHRKGRREHWVLQVNHHRSKPGTSSHTGCPTPLWVTATRALPKSQQIPGMQGFPVTGSYSSSPGVTPWPAQDLLQHLPQCKKIRRNPRVTSHTERKLLRTGRKLFKAGRKL